MIKHTLRRLTRASAAELRFRCGERTWVAVEGLQYGIGSQWKRERLARRLAPCSPALERAIHAIQRRDWSAANAELCAHFLQRPSRFVLNPADRPSIVAAARALFPSAPEAAARRGSAVVEHRYDLLGFEDLSFERDGVIVDWHFDPVHQRRAPPAFWARVPYLDPRCGDHKIIWELNRHQHWLALGRAAWLTDDPRYALACVDELAGWMRANPPLTGINWCSMLELAFRSISWIWALHFVLSFGELATRDWTLDLLLGLERQLTHLERHLSFYFSPNTHLLGEALALYIAGQVLPEFRSAARWAETGRTILLRERHVQVNPDGGHAEQSTHYHRYALDFYLLALAVARKARDDAAGEFAEIAAAMASFCHAVADHNGRLPTIGDDDGGLLFPICGRSPDDARDSLAIAAALLSRPELGPDVLAEEAFWMVGGDLGRLSPLVEHNTRGSSFPSRLFPESGYAVINSATSHAVLDVGPHGFMNGGHSHADALSVTLSVRGRPLLIDPGTGSYTDLVRRDRFRSTAMHNTVVVDGRPQALPAGPFHWRTRANGRVEMWRPSFAIGELDIERSSPEGEGEHPLDTAFDYVEATHDGYLPLVHCRSVFRLPEDLWLVVDYLIGTGPHRADIYWHFDPAWSIEKTEKSAATFVREGGYATIASTARSFETFKGDREGLGWCAPRYGRVVPALTLRASAERDLPLSALTAVAASAHPVRLEIEPAPVSSDEDGYHSAAAVVNFNGTRLIVLVSIPTTARGPGHVARTMRSIAVEDGELLTDARIAVLRRRASGDLLSFTMLGGTVATFQGRCAFSLPTQASARDLHLGSNALTRLSRPLNLSGRTDHVTALR
jgi:Heparinase II/III-like protein/Heparinase II/III N-terminus